VKKEIIVKVISIRRSKLAERVKTTMDESSSVGKAPSLLCPGTSHPFDEIAVLFKGATQQGGES